MATAAELERQYQEVRGGRKGYGDIQQELSGELGIADRRKQLENISKTILDTERLLEGVPTAVQLRSRQLGGPMTSAQTSRMTSAQSAPFTKQIGELGRAEQSGQVGLNELNTELLRRLGLVSQERSEETSDWTRRIAQAQSEEQFAKQLALQNAQINAQRQQYMDANKILEDYYNNLGLRTKGRVGGSITSARTTSRPGTSRSSNARTTTTKAPNFLDSILSLFGGGKGGTSGGVGGW